MAPLQIRDVMTREVVTAMPTTPVGEIAQLLTTHRISAVPIVDHAGRLLGIVSRTDLIRPLTRPDEAIRQDIIDELRHTLWIEPRELQVHVDAGVVTLSGAVGRRSTAAIAARLTDTIPGVVAVVDRIRYDFDDAALARSHVNTTHPFSAEPFAP